MPAEPSAHAAAPYLFGTVPRQDYLRFWPRGAFDAQRVVRFLDLTKNDIAGLADVSAASVRFDRKAPKTVIECLTEIATVCSLVAQFFEGDITKSALWFTTRNPQLGDLSPRDMIRHGRFAKLRTFVLDALAQTGKARASSQGQTVPVNEGLSRRGRERPMIAVHCATIGTLCRRYRVRELALFGSILRPDFDPAQSDIDMVVEFSDPASFSAHQYFDFKRALEQLFGRKVDLVEWSALPASRLRRIIERTREPVYAEAA